MRISEELTRDQESALESCVKLMHAVGLPAYAEALEQREHVIEVRPASYGVQHPISCRPDLLACPVEIAMSEMHAPPGPPGRYVGRLPEDDRPGLWMTALGADGGASC